MQKMKSGRCSVGLAIMALLSAISCLAQTAPPSDVTARCQALQSADFSAVPDASTQILSATAVNASGEEPTYCDIRGYVAPNVKFALRMPPDRWNGKFLELGCGGSCGSLDHISRCEGPLSRGYACIVSDGGHPSTGGEMQWAHGHPQAAIEYFVRASHVAALAGKAIVARFYARGPNQSYFMGCSAGGVQAMWEAQRFPWDFNGIAAGGPALRLSGIWVNWIWGNRALMGKNGEPLLGESEFELLHRAVVAKCDMNDGVKDGVIGDPRKCRFEPSELRCAVAGSKGCLASAQVEAVEKIYTGPVNSKGELISPPIALRGSELSWLAVFGGSREHPTMFYNYLKDWFEYSVYRIDFGPQWTIEKFDFDRDYQRLGAMEALEPNNPDLRKFKAAGGKLLAYTGWNDAIEGVLNTAQYYETAERVTGGRTATQDFFRLFVIPGMDHCSGGDGAFAVDYLNYLEDWVEKGHAPEKIIGSHVKLDDSKALQALQLRGKFPPDPAAVEFSRPIYPYPVEVKYRGHGDANSAASFEAAR